MQIFQIDPKKLPALEAFLTSAAVGAVKATAIPGPRPATATPDDTHEPVIVILD